MSRTSAELDAVRSECLNLLVAHYVYRKTFEEMKLGEADRFELLRWIVTLRILENDLILRLCRLDDDEKTNHSFREAVRSLEKTIPQTEVQELHARLKTFRQSINPIKTKARNFFVAHLSKSADVPFLPEGGLGSLVLEAVAIVDALAGSAVQYSFSVGSQEKPLDLRLELSDASAQR